MSLNVDRIEWAQYWPFQAEKNKENIKLRRLIDTDLKYAGLYIEYSR